MNLTRHGRRAGLVLTVLACLMLSGCTKDVSQGGVEKEVDRVLSKAGDKVEDVSCDGGLKGEVGATQDCSATVNAKDTDYLATVCKVDDNVVSFVVSPVTDSSTSTDDVCNPTDDPSGSPTDSPTDSSTGSTPDSPDDSTEPPTSSDSPSE